MFSNVSISPANGGKIGSADKIFLDSEICVKPIKPWDFSLFMKDGKFSVLKILLCTKE